MKKAIVLINIFVLIFLISCSNNDVVVLNDINIPLTIGNYWKYDVEENGVAQEDYLSISGDIVIGSNSYKKFETFENLPVGFYSLSLNDNGVRQLENALLLTGNIPLNEAQNLPFNLDLNLVDFKIFKGNASLNETLSTKNGTINQTINDYPLIINYQLKSIAGNNFTSFTSPNTDVFMDVKEVKIVLTVSITTIISGITITVLSSQDILTSNQYVANNIGVVHTNTIINYTIPQLIADQINLPANSTQIQNEYLTSYFVQ
jgi:hypothetical protein